jgi:hypothetical protein
MWINSFGRASAFVAGIIRWIILIGCSGVRGHAGIIHVGRLFIHSLGHFVCVLRVRWVILFGSARGSHSLDNFVGCLLGSFHVYSWI